MKKKKELSSNSFHIRIKNERELLRLNECMDSGRFNTFNDLFNLCLEIALPQILEAPANSSVYYQNNIKRLENKIVSKIDREFKVLHKDMTKQLILTQLNTDMLSTIVQIFTFYLKTQGIQIDDKMVENFAQNLPKLFANLKDIYIKNMLD